MASEPDTLEAQCRTLMAERADLTVTWDHRTERLLLLARIDAQLDRYLLATLVEAMATA